MKHFLLLFLLLFSVTGCAFEGGETQSIGDTPNLDSELDYSIIEKSSIKWNEVFSHSEDRYIVYFYSQYCGYCRTVKQEVLSYYLTKTDAMYFIDAIKEDAIFGKNDGSLIGTKKIEELYILGTPFLLEITDWTVTNWYAGVDSVRLYINTRLEI